MKRFEKRNLFIGNKKPLLCKGFYYLSTESETDYLLIAGILQYIYKISFQSMSE